MTTIRLHNSKTRKKEAFTPLDPENVRVYLCGPTVYDRAHLGNARNVILFDVLVRVLRHVYGAEHVTYARNFTDVDDKINARAAESGRSIGEITEETIGWYHADMDALGNARPDQEPRATEWIAPMVAMIERLIDAGHAYAAEGHVLFAVESFEDYGALSGRSVDDMIAGARVEVAPYKRNPMDFVMWKPSGQGQPGWESPWGYGRPGWHIECSAMIESLFEKDADGFRVDIHGGGLDLTFPHHENERAQSCCADGTGDLARVWLHNEMLLVEGKKMSKSLGNFFTVRDLLDQGVPGEVIRYVFLMTHYGKPMDWTEKKRGEAAAALEEWAKLVLENLDNTEVAPCFHEVVYDDLNTPDLLTVMHKCFGLGEAAKLLGLARGVGLLSETYLDSIRIKREAAETQSAESKRKSAEAAADRLFDNGQEVIVVSGAKYFDGLWSLGWRLSELRETALETKDFWEVDRLKAQLVCAGVEVRISKSGVELSTELNFDPSKLEGLL